MASKTESKDSSLVGDTSMEKKRRKRHKKLLLDVCQQVEFYFSDANLRKDRFLKQEMAKSKDGYVNVDTIANFNKLQSMTKDGKMLVCAIQQSEILQLSEDQQYVKRKEPLKPPKYDPDDCTVYVECLPKKTDHDWLRKAFSYCGKVVYVSLPRYKSTSDIKGFAFIEFECPKEAERACELMNNPPPDVKDRVGKFPKMRGNKRIVPLEFDQGKGRLSTVQRAQGKDAEENKTSYRDNRDNEIRSEKEKESDFTRTIDGSKQKQSQKRRLEEEEEQEKTLEGRQKKVLSESDRDADKQLNGKSETSKPADAPKGPKRKRAEETTVENRRTKRIETSSSESRERSGEDEEEEKRKILREARVQIKRKRSLSEGDMWSARENDVDDDDRDQGNKMKKHKAEETDDGKEDDGLERKKRNRKKKMKRIQEEEEVLFLRVISKREWLLLKEEYLTLQKESLAQMKEAQRITHPLPVFRRQTQQQSQVSKSDQPEATPAGNPTESKKNEPVFVEGTVMKLECLQTSVTRKEVKEHLQSISPVAYVDLPDGHTKGFVRFESSEGPKAVLEETNTANLASHHISLSLVSGNEEKAYWEKLSHDREIKLSSKQKKKKKKGVNKNVQMSGKGSGKEKTHIRFDE